MRAIPKTEDYDNEPVLWSGRKMLLLEDLKQWAEEAEQENEELREALTEASIQIEYLHEKFSETGSGNNILARIEKALNK